MFCPLSNAAQLDVSVVDDQGSPVKGAVVYLTSSSPLPAVKPGTMADMDQVKKQFKPHILVVQKGTQVRFPNSDSIQHHVYSFSPAKPFELQLYKDHHPDPLMFDQQGQVELGCNVHDWMLGYIMVVDTPYFAQANAQGLATFDVPPGRYTLHLRHPRIQDDPKSLDLPLLLDDHTAHTFSLQEPLLPGLDEFEEQTDEFSGYE
ncbi:methylamine utilization protein [Bowmanella dokdonensis]|uniref:Methylamine utilization protein n=1 Tax=Bowmanella dokdonensis TaxID=751969 RepID=A0A939DPJ3_9ALTE|nr:methylamine utilization protein [Bowmanella dokdonensis]